MYSAGRSLPPLPNPIPTAAGAAYVLFYISLYFTSLQCTLYIVQRSSSHYLTFHTPLCRTGLSWMWFYFIILWCISLHYTSMGSTVYSEQSKTVLHRLSFWICLHSEFMIFVTIKFFCFVTFWRFFPFFYISFVVTFRFQS